MHLVTAIIRPHRLDAVRSAVGDAGVTGLTLTEVKGFGRQLGHTELYRGAQYRIDFVPKLKLEVAVADERLEAVVDAIRRAAGTGQVGDGKIFIAQLDDAVRIRTGETGADAL